MSNYVYIIGMGLVSFLIRFLPGIPFILFNSGLYRTI